MIAAWLAPLVSLAALGSAQAKNGQEGVDVDSLAITEASVTWTASKGQPESAPL